MERLIRGRIAEIDLEIKAYQDKVDVLDKKTFSDRFNKEHMASKRLLLKKIDNKMKARQTNLDIIGASNASL